MPVRVVEWLEIVQIDEHDRQLLAGADALSNGLDEAVFEQCPVGQAGQGIMQGHDLCLLLQPDEFAFGFLEPGDVMPVEVNVIGLLNRSDRERKGPFGGFNLGLTEFAFGQHIRDELAQEPRHF